MNFAYSLMTHPIILTDFLYFFIISGFRFRFSVITVFGLTPITFFRNYILGTIPLFATSENDHPFQTLSFGALKSFFDKLNIARKLFLFSCLHLNRLYYLSHRIQPMYTLTHCCQSLNIDSRRPITKSYFPLP